MENLHLMFFIIMPFIHIFNLSIRYIQFFNKQLHCNYTSCLLNCKDQILPIVSRTLA